MTHPRTFIAQCEQEALHRSGAIQPHGCLVVLAPNLRPTHVSANICDWLGDDAQHWLTHPLPEDLARILSIHSGDPSSRQLIPDALQSPRGALDLSLTRNSDGGFILEFTQVQGPPPLPQPPQIRAWSNDAGMALARQHLIEHIAQSTGAQRVLYYAFQEAGDGEVLAETRQATAFGSYLGLHFPASDIPRIARQLYLRNPWRLIPDARQAPVPLLGCTDGPPDLSNSDLRSVSPIHQTYLSNMGVVGALSFPVVMGGELSALISAHHTEPLLPGAPLLERLAEEVQLFSMHLGAYRAQARMRLIDTLEHSFNALRHILLRHGGLQSAWPELAPKLIQMFQSDGACLCQNGQAHSHGTSLEPAALATLEHWFGSCQNDPVWAGDHLVGEVPGFPLSEIAGVLAIKVLPSYGSGPGMRLYFTRSEHIQEIAWGGNPDKPIEYHDGQLGIAPRRSFEKWIERRLGHSRPWDNAARLQGLRLREMLHKECTHP